MKALCLIPPTTFPKGQPVSASVQLPPGTAEVYWWFVAAPLMQERRTFRGLAEIRWRAAGGNFADSTLTSVRVAGGPGQASGGISGEQPATLPTVCEAFDWDPRDSQGGGSSPDSGAEWVRVTIVPEAGNNGGSIWCGAVIAAIDQDGNSLTFDPATRGS